jgi:hypothetical protein
MTIQNKTKRMSSWNFDLSEKPARQAQVQDDPMMYVLTFGKYKSETLGSIMQTSAGRQYLQWLKMQPCTEPEWQDAHNKRVERINYCFQVFDAYVALHSKKE